MTKSCHSYTKWRAKAKDTKLSSYHVKFYFLRNASFAKVTQDMTNYHLTPKQPHKQS